MWQLNKKRFYLYTLRVSILVVRPAGIRGLTGAATAGIFGFSGIILVVLFCYKSEVYKLVVNP